MQASPAGDTGPLLLPLPFEAIFPPLTTWLPVLGTKPGLKLVQR